MFLEGHSAVYYAPENVVYLYGGYLIDQQRYSAELIRVHVGLMQPRQSSSSSSSAGKEMAPAPSASDSSQFIFRNPSAASSENSVVQSSSSAVVAQPQGHTATKLFEPPPGWSASRTAGGDGYEKALGGGQGGGGSNGHSDPYLSTSARRAAAVAQSASLSVRTERFVPTTGDHPGPRAYHGCCIVDHYLYLYGGSNDSDAHDDDLLLHPASSSLSPEGDAAAASAAASSSSSSLLNDLHVLDLQTMQWERRVPSVRNYPDASRTHGELIPSGSGTLWYVGGFTDKTRSSGGGGGVSSAEEDALLQEILLDGTVRRKLIGHRGVAGRLATPLWGQSTAALSDGTFVVIGGMNSQTEELAGLMGNRKRCEELAWEEGAWQSTMDHGASSSSSSGPCRRMLHSLVSVHRVPNDPASPVAGLLLFGGFTDSPDESDLVNEAEDLQAHQALSSLRCPVLSPEYLPPPRDPITMRSATKADTAAVSREEGATPCMLQDVWWYSTAVGMWEQWATKGPLPAARSGHAAVVAGPYMLLFGGTSSDWDPPHPSSSSSSSSPGKDRRGVGRTKAQWLTVDWVCHALELRTRQWSVCLLDQEFHREHATTSSLSASAQLSPAGRARATTTLSSASPPSSSSEAAARRESPLDAVLANVSAASAGGKRAAVAGAPKRSSLPQAGRSVAAPPSPSSSTSRPLSFFSTFDPSYGTNNMVPPSSRPTIGNSFSPVLLQQQQRSLRPDDDASFASPAGDGGVIARLRDPRLLVSLQDSPPNNNFNRHDYSSRRQQQYVGSTASSPSSFFASPNSAQVAQTSHSTPSRGGNTTTFQFVSPSSPSSSAAYASPGGGILLKRPSAFRSSGGGDEIDAAVYANVTSMPSTTTAVSGGSRRRGGSPSPRMVRFLLGSAELGSRSSAEREIQVVSPSLLDDDEVLLN